MFQHSCIDGRELVLGLGQGQEGGGHGMTVNETSRTLHMCACPPLDEARRVCWCMENGPKEMAAVEL